MIKYHILNIAVCSTPVEMFLNSSCPPSLSVRLLHARGDVSSKAESYPSDDMFAPRPWRCFVKGHDFTGVKSVCSTPVEMFLSVSSGQPGC